MKAQSQLSPNLVCRLIVHSTMNEHNFTVRLLVKDFLVSLLKALSLLVQHQITNYLQKDKHTCLFTSEAIFPQCFSPLTSFPRCLPANVWKGNSTFRYKISEIEVISLIVCDGNRTFHPRWQKRKKIRLRALCWGCLLGRLLWLPSAFLCFLWSFAWFLLSSSNTTK